MNWDALGAVGEIVGAVAVVATVSRPIKYSTWIFII